METMLSNIHDEKNTLTNILLNFQDKNKHILKDLKDYKIKRILILATGSSINAAITVKYFLQDILEAKVFIEEPSIFYDYEKIDLDLDLIIVISQSGKSTSTINATKKIAEVLKKPVIIVTNNLESPITKYSQYILDLNIGIENVGFVTKGFSGTVLNLFLLGMNLKNQHFKYFEELEYLIGNINTVIENTNLYFEKNKEILREINRFICLGYGANYGITKEFETKFTEVVRCPSTGHELEAYMHGPYLEANNSNAIFYLDLDLNITLSKRLHTLKKYMENYIGFSTIITNSKNKDNQTINLNVSKDVNPNFLTLLYIIPIQILSYKIAQEKKINVEKKIFTDFDLVLKSKI
ncbi:MAG: SIS domain-containing protein [Cetobacterium sp.]